jgi:hypothetical protein
MNLLGVQRSRPAAATDSTTGGRAKDAGARRRHAPIAPEARSCCCPAAPVAQVIIAPAGARPAETGILLCAHHLRASQAALRDRGAAVSDKRGDLLDDLNTIFVRDR